MEKIIDPALQPGAYTFQRPSTLPEKDDDKSCHVLTINKAPTEVYNFCKNKNNFEIFMKNLDFDFKWDVRLATDEMNQTIAWHSMPESEIETSGHIWFTKAPQDLGTVATVVMDYSLPGAIEKEMLAKFKGENINMLILTNLKRVKCLIETGEIATIQGQTSGKKEDEEIYIQ